MQSEADFNEQSPGSDQLSWRAQEDKGLDSFLKELNPTSYSVERPSS
jgi:hypothetical protein